MPRSISAGELDTLMAPHFETYGRLSIDGTLVESVLGYDPLLSATWGADLDQLVQQAAFQLHLGIGAEADSPLMASAAQLDGRALFDVGRTITLETLCAAPGAEGEWHTVFTGPVDRYNPAGGDDVLVIDARDKFSNVLDTWIEESEVTTTPTPVEDWLPLLLSNGPGLFAVTPFVVIGEPNFMLDADADKKLITPIGSTLEAMRQVGLLNGWDLRGRFGTGTFGPETYVLTYFDPIRDKTTPDWTFGPSKYFEVKALEVSRSSVRNRIRVTPAGDRVPVLVQDITSQNLYGLYFMEMSEEVWSHIDTPAEALNLANYALSDLKDPKATGEVELPYFWPLELNDLVRFEANNVHHDQPLDLAVSGYTHTLFEDGDATTIIRTRTKPSAANQAWRHNPPKTIYCKPSDPVGGARPGALWLKKVSNP